MAPFGLVQERLQHVLDEIDPVDLSHLMWAMARFDSYPAPALVDEVLATLPPQIASAEPAVSLASHPGFLLIVMATDAPGYMPMDKHIRCIVICPMSNTLFVSDLTTFIICICPTA